MKDEKAFLALMTDLADYVLESRKERHERVGMEEFQDLLMREGGTSALEDVRMLRLLEALDEEQVVKAEMHRAEHALALFMNGVLSEAVEGRRNYCVIKAFREDFREGEFGDPAGLIRAPLLVWDTLVKRGLDPELDDRRDFTYGRCFHIRITW